MYCSIADITAAMSESTVAQLTDDADGIVVNTTLVTENIEVATAEIDTFLRGRYPLPLETIPTEIKRLCIDMTAYYLHRRRNAIAKDDNVRIAFEDALRALREYQSGARQLDVGTTPGKTSTKVIRSNKTSTNRVFTEDLLNRAL